MGEVLLRGGDITGVLMGTLLPMRLSDVERRVVDHYLSRVPIHHTLLRPLTVMFWVQRLLSGEGVRPDAAWRQRHIETVLQAIEQTPLARAGG